jgi:hypothetical protein
MPHTIHTPRPFTTNIVFYIALCLALCALCFMTGCGSGGGPSDGADDTKAYAAATPGAARDSMHVLDSTYQRITALFADNFDAGAGQAVLFTEQEIPYSLLLTLAPGGRERHALHIDYGLMNDSMRFAFCVVQLDTTADPSVFHYTVNDTVYDWYQGQFTAFVRSEWRTKFQYDTASTDVYFSKVRVRHTPSGAFAPLDPAADAYADVLAWEDEVVELYTQNSQGHPDSTHYTVFSCIGRPDANAELRHGMCMYMLLRPTGEPTAPGRKLLDNSYEAGSLLKMHGADFGSLCPPGNGLYELPRQ